MYHKRTKNMSRQQQQLSYRQRSSLSKSWLSSWIISCAVVLLLQCCVDALIPLLDGGKDMPKLYKGYFDSQIAKQASTAVAAAINSGKTNIEVFLPSVPNLEEVRFGYV
jgi:hypothetical protein